jgi:hypothetical protein
MAKGPPQSDLPSQSALESFPEYARAIGMITAEIARLEMALADMLAALLHIDRHFGHIIYLTPKANFARIEILENVVRDSIKDGSIGRNLLESFIARARASMGKRHEYMHNVWGTDNKNDVSRRPLPYRETKPFTQVPLTELTGEIDKIRRLIDEVREQTDKMFSAWPPYTSRNKSPEPQQAAKGPSDHPRKDVPPRRSSPPRSSRK